jgi:hypothetical protein
MTNSSYPVKAMPDKLSVNVIALLVLSFVYHRSCNVKHAVRSTASSLKVWLLLLMLLMIMTTKRTRMHGRRLRRMRLRDLWVDVRMVSLGLRGIRPLRHRPRDESKDRHDKRVYKNSAEEGITETAEPRLTKTDPNHV